MVRASRLHRIPRREPYPSPPSDANVDAGPPRADDSGSAPSFPASARSLAPSARRTASRLCSNQRCGRRNQEADRPAPDRRGRRHPALQSVAADHRRDSRMTRGCLRIAPRKSGEVSGAAASATRGGESSAGRSHMVAPLPSCCHRYTYTSARLFALSSFVTPAPCPPSVFSK